MILHQFYLNCLAHASYLVGDEQTRTAAVVDPQRDIDQYLSFAGEHGLRIAHVFLTHLHADFIAGHLELRDRAGATIYLGAAARAEYAFTPLHDADGAGSWCGKALSKETVSTIGEQRRLKYALQPMTKAAFVDLVTADQPDAPPYFTYDAVLNSKERPTLDEALAREVNPITLEHVLALQQVGGQILDTRDAGDFAAAHLAGSINIGLGGQYATWAGTILSRERPIVIIADPGREHEATTRLGRIGFDHIVGYLQDGLRSLESRPGLTATTERLSPALAAERLATSEPLAVDVRTPRERDQQFVPGSVSIPLNHLIERLPELPGERPLLVYCAGGYRSSIAASLLQQHGFARVSEIAGGITAWETAKLPVEPTIRL